MSYEHILPCKSSQMELFEPFKHGSYPSLLATIVTLATLHGPAFQRMLLIGAFEIVYKNKIGF